MFVFLGIMQQYDNVEMSEKSNEIKIRMECMDNKTAEKHMS